MTDAMVIAELPFVAPRATSRGPVRAAFARRIEHEAVNTNEGDRPTKGGPNEGRTDSKPSGWKPSAHKGYDDTGVSHGGTGKLCVRRQSRACRRTARTRAHRQKDRDLLVGERRRQRRRGRQALDRKGRSRPCERGPGDRRGRAAAVRGDRRRLRSRRG